MVYASSVWPPNPPRASHSHRVPVFSTQWRDFQHTTGLHQTRQKHPSELCMYSRVPSNPPWKWGHPCIREATPIFRERWLGLDQRMSTIRMYLLLLAPPPSPQRILVRMSKAHVTVNDWKALYKTTYNGILVGDLCRSLPQHISIFKRVSPAMPILKRSDLSVQGQPPQISTQTLNYLSVKSLCAFK